MKNLFLLISAVVGVFSAFALNHYVIYNPVTASAIIGLIGCLFFNNYAGIIYAASFAGMSGDDILSYPFAVIFSGLVLFCFWIMLENKMKGLGGRLGTIAFMSVILVSIVQYLAVPGYEFPIINPELFNADAFTAFAVIASGIAGAAITYFLRKALGLEPVFASVMVGLCAGLLYPFSSNASLSAYAASFAAMSSLTIMNNYKISVIIGLLCGIIYLLMTSFFPGFGGKLGFIGLLAVLSFIKIKGLNIIPENYLT